MNESEIVQWIGNWLATNDYEVEGSLGGQKATDVLDSSLDIMELTMDLEEALGVGDDIDLEDLMPKFATLTFAELAHEIAKLTHATEEKDDD